MTKSKKRDSTSKVSADKKLTKKEEQAKLQKELNKVRRYEHTQRKLEADIFIKQYDDAAYEKFIMDNYKTFDEEGELDDEFVTNFMFIFKKARAHGTKSKFCISSGFASVWLGFTRHRTLVQKMQKGKYDGVVLGTNYKIEQVSTDYGEKNVAFMTLQCFCKLAMQVKTAKAELLRVYFITMYSLLQAFYQHINRVFNKRVDILENNRKSVSNREKDSLYMFEASDAEETMKFLCALDPVLLQRMKMLGIGPRKIGKSRATKSRASNQNTIVADSIDYTTRIDVDDGDLGESILKLALKQFAYRQSSGKEIFIINDNLGNDIMHIADKLCSIITKYYELLDARGCNYDHLIHVDPLFKKMEKDLNAWIKAQRRYADGYTRVYDEKDKGHLQFLEKLEERKINDPKFDKFKKKYESVLKDYMEL